MGSTPRRIGTLAAATAIALALSACGSGGGASAEDDDHLLVWTTEVQPDRVAATEAVLDDFTAETGIDVDLVPVEDADISQQLSAAALAGEMPDVIGGIVLGHVRAFDVDGYLDRDAAAQVVDALGVDTFNASALELTQDDGEQLAVPSDAWAQMLVYRTDLFEEAGLEPPTTYDAILEAADALTTDGRYGIVVATDAADGFTQQTFESLALANDCELVDADGTVTLDSPECLETIELYQELTTQDAPPGSQGVESTRAAYFSGQAAMTIWSTFLLDELAGLRNDAAPSCAECTTSSWLAEHTGVVSAIEGPSGSEPVGLGEVTSWAITDGASTDDAQTLVEYMMSTGYLGWLGQAPEGKFPVRLGTADDPTEYIDGWTTLPTGVDTRVPLADVYPADTIETITSVTDSLDRWAFEEGQGAIVGPLSAELPISRILADLSTGAIDAQQAQQQMQDAVTEIADR